METALLSWRRRHVPHVDEREQGRVVNANRNLSPDYLQLHKAWCPTIPDPRRGAYTPAPTEPSASRPSLGCLAVDHLQREALRRISQAERIWDGEPRSFLLLHTGAMRTAIDHPGWDPSW